MNRFTPLRRNMEFIFSVLVFVAVILHTFINISESMDEPAAKERIKNNIKKMIKKGIKVEQHHFNELADKEVFRAEMRTFGTRMKETPRLSIIKDWCRQHGLYAYGPVYDRIRSHGATDLTGSKEEIADIVNAKEFLNEDKKQQIIDVLARGKTAALLDQEHENLISDGYPSKTIDRLLEQRGLFGEGSVYEKLRQPFEPREVKAMDLQLPKNRIQDRMKWMKRSQLIVSEDDHKELAEQERARLEAEYRAIAAKELPKNESSAGYVYQSLRERGLLHNEPGCITKELEKSLSILDPEKQVSERKRARRERFFERGETSSSRP